MFGVGSEETVVSDEMAPRAWNECGQTSDEVERLEQDVSGAVAEGVFELIDDEAIAIDAETL